MRSYLIPAIVAVSLGAGGVAMAATTTGEVKAFDMTAHTLTLADGTVYILPQGFKDPGLKIGEKVSVVWELKAGKNDASAVTIMK